MSINICICGGGGLGHVIAGVAAHKGFNVSVLTRHPEQWNPSLLIENCRGNTFSGSLACVTANPAEVIPHTLISYCFVSPDLPLRKNFSTYNRSCRKKLA